MALPVPVSNDRIEVAYPEIEFTQSSPSHSGQTMYTPGKATSGSLDQNWPTDFKIPTGTPAVDTQVTADGQFRVRVFERGSFDPDPLHQRQVDSDTNLIDASSLAVAVTGIQGDDTGGSTADTPMGEYDDPGTVTLDNDGTLERTSGYNGIVKP